MKQLVISCLLGFCFFCGLAQNVKPKPKLTRAIFKDSLDGKLDLSRFLTDYHGFIPVPQLITEPALGDFGFMLAPVFIEQNKYNSKTEYVEPNITAAFAGYTANKSWGVGALRIASLPKYHLKYKVLVTHGDINMSFYRDYKVFGEQSLEFNFKATGAHVSLMHQIFKTDLYVGMEYMFYRNNLEPYLDGQDLPEFVPEEELVSNISSLGVNLELDKRDSMFTPDKGWHIYSEFQSSASWIGSDYNFQNWNTAIFKYIPFSSKWIGGFRFESKVQFGDAPFYSKPGVNLRGVPMARYQGDQTYVLETEQRYDLGLRWSVLGFTGMGKAINSDEGFNNAELIINYGTGIRYLIARKFKLRTGIDVAWANGDFGWYVVFGSAWTIRN